MSNEFRCDNRVAIITGAGGGLGKAYALVLAGRGAKVVVNDLGGGRHGDGSDSAPADNVVAEIKAAGGEAVANYDSVENGERIVQAALDHFGRVDIVINNAGILRDVSFHKMTDEDWELIYRVHLLGAYKVTHAAWPYLRDQHYGRVIMTTSAAGLYGNFGQANYSAMKLGLLGFANTLAVEGQKRNVHVNTIAPVAGSRLTETILSPELVAALKPEYVAPLVAYLCHESCAETGGLFEVGAGWMARLRWQRTKGAAFPLRQPLTPEAIAEKWATVCDFTDADNPATVQDSTIPVMANLKSIHKAGSEFVDPDTAIGFQFPPTEFAYTEREASLYALAVGTARDPLDPQDLQFVYENHADGFKVLPTFAVIFPFEAATQLATTKIPGLIFNPMMILQGEHYLELKRPIPTRCRLTNHVKISNIYDKGKGALVLIDANSVDENGQEIVFNQYSVFLRGIGDFGGERGPSGDIHLPPHRPPDATQSEKTGENQAMLYRLASGDFNPLHTDPSMAAIGGFDRPILHGLCSFGFACRAVLKHFAHNDPARFKSVKVRFTKHVFPGETLVTEMWKESDARIIFQCKVAERNEVVLSNAAVELFAPGEAPQAVTAQPASVTAPKPTAQPGPQPAQAPAASASKSQAIFEKIGQQVTPEMVRKVGVVYQFTVTGDEGGQYVLDLKNPPGGVRLGEDPVAECKLTASYEDLAAMASGQLNPQVAYMSGRLKISGNIMLSAKLTGVFTDT